MYIVYLIKAGVSEVQFFLFPYNFCVSKFSAFDSVF